MIQRHGRALLLVICTIGFLNSCDDPLWVVKKYSFKIQNNSSALIYYQVSKTYPDQAIPDSTAARIGGIGPSNQQSYESKDKWPKFFSNLPADTLSVFFFSPDSVEKYNWKQVQSKYLILKRKDISLKDLVDNDYVVSYP